MCEFYEKNVTFKGGWNGREVSYFNRGWILQEFMSGKPYTAGSVYDECMGGLSRYEASVRELQPEHRVIWVTCWSALLWYTDGLTRSADAENAFAVLIRGELADRGRAVLGRIAGLWREVPPLHGMRSIRDAMAWVCRALGEELFMRESLTVERMLCEATMVLMASMHRMVTYRTDADLDDLEEMWSFLEAVLVASRMAQGRTYPDCVTLV